MIPRAGSSLYSTLADASDSDDSDEDKKTAMLIASSISTQGLLPWRTPPTTPTTTAHTAHARTARADGTRATHTDEVMAPEEESAAAPARGGAKSAASAADPAMADVPRSMQEIYEISNKNRKRNKEKRKLKETSKETAAEPFSPVKFSTGSDESFDGAENDTMQGTPVCVRVRSCVCGRVCAYAVVRSCVCVCGEIRMVCVVSCRVSCRVVRRWSEEAEAERSERRGVHEVDRVGLGGGRTAGAGGGQRAGPVRLRGRAGPVQPGPAAAVAGGLRPHLCPARLPQRRIVVGVGVGRTQPAAAPDAGLPAGALRSPRQSQYEHATQHPHDTRRTRHDTRS